MFYHMTAFLIGFILDLIIGDPHSMPHPIRLIGNMIAFFEKKLNTDPKSEKAFKRGLLLVLLVTVITTAAAFAVIAGAYLLNVIFGVIVEAVLTYYIFAARSLCDESMKVCHALENGDVEGARRAVSMIVGRDTNVLDDIGIAKAAIETVAENTSDGVIAPLIYTAIGGPVIGFLYKSINTMDSMIGYKNDRYMRFGTAAAKLDDIVNFIPSRISAWMMIFASFFMGKGYRTKDAVRIFKRDRFNHASPNSAQTESVAAGALGIQLAGDAVYFGVLYKKKFIGDALKKVEYNDIRKINRLMILTAVLSAAAAGFIMFIIVLF